MKIARSFAKMLLLAGLFGLLFLPIARPMAPAAFAQEAGASSANAKPALALTDRLATDDRDLFLETADWKVGFSLAFNGGVYQIFDKVADPEMKDNLVSGPNYGQGGLFDYDVYLSGQQEFMTTIGKSRKPGRESLTVLENTPVRARLKQECHPRLNNGEGPAGDPYYELDMVKATTEWTIYATGRVYIKFDAVVPPEWNGIVAQGSGGDGKGISVDGFLIKGANGTDFYNPWVTVGDTIESKTGGWGPLEITRRQDKFTLRVPKSLPKADNLDFIVRRPYIDNETISIHADGAPSVKGVRHRTWDGGSNGVPVFGTGREAEEQRGGVPPINVDYVFAHWTRAPRGFGSLLVFNEPYDGANYAVINDYNYGDISYTQYGRGGRRPFQPHHRHFLAQIGIENAGFTPKIKGIPDSLPFADDYLHPYAEARTGTLKTGEGISKHGFHVPTGAYQIAAKNKVAAIAFDALRGKSVTAPLPYQSPAVLVFGLDAADKKLAVELSQDNGKTYKPLADSEYNVTTQAEAAQLGGKDRRLVQLLKTVPAEATGAKAWVLRLRAK
jgi:hypothetical protein